MLSEICSNFNFRHTEKQITKNVVYPEHCNGQVGQMETISRLE